jgi:hypothetical protein
MVCHTWWWRLDGAYLTIFDVVKSIFDKNSEMIDGDLKCKEKVRIIFTQVENSLVV